MLRVVDVGAVVVERRECAYQASHDGHGMRIAPEATQEKLHLFIHHRVVGDSLGEFRLRRTVGEVAVEQQMASLHEVTVGRQLLDRVAAVLQLSLVAVDVSDARLARRR